MARSNETLAELFESCGMTTQEVLRKARGLTARTIWNIENGYVGSVRSRTIEDLAKACRVPQARVAAAVNHTIALACAK